MKKKKRKLLQPLFQLKKFIQAWPKFNFFYIHVHQNFIQNSVVFSHNSLVIIALKCNIINIFIKILRLRCQK